MWEDKDIPPVIVHRLVSWKVHDHTTTPNTVTHIHWYTCMSYHRMINSNKPANSRYLGTWLQYRRKYHIQSLWFISTQNFCYSMRILLNNFSTNLQQYYQLSGSYWNIFILWYYSRDSTFKVRLPPFLTRILYYLTSFPPLIRDPTHSVDCIL